MILREASALVLLSTLSIEWELVVFSLLPLLEDAEAELGTRTGALRLNFRLTLTLPLALPVPPEVEACWADDG